MPMMSFPIREDRTRTIATDQEETKTKEEEATVGSDSTRVEDKTSAASMEDMIGKFAC